jgi:hypothetical protein
MIDILSFDEDGTERPIEVKATSSENLQFGFYLTDNELKKSKELPNFHIYFVFQATGKSPKVFPLRNPVLENGNFDIHPVNYRVFPCVRPVPNTTGN